MWEELVGCLFFHLVNWKPLSTQPNRPTLGPTLPGFWRISARSFWRRWRHWEAFRARNRAFCPLSGISPKRFFPQTHMTWPFATTKMSCTFSLVLEIIPRQIQMLPYEAMTDYASLNQTKIKRLQIEWNIRWRATKIDGSNSAVWAVKGGAIDFPSSSYIVILSVTNRWRGSEGSLLICSPQPRLS